MSARQNFTSLQNVNLLSMKTPAAGFAGFALGLIAMWTLQDLTAAGQASKNVRSAAEARNISIALEKYRAATGHYPPMDRGLSQIEPFLVPRFATGLSRTDMYGRPYIVVVDSSGASVISTGRNGFVVRNGNVAPDPKNNW